VPLSGPLRPTNPSRKEKIPKARLSLVGGKVVRARGDATDLSNHGGDAGLEDRTIRQRDLS
jgi:hypothetical protein